MIVQLGSIYGHALSADFNETTGFIDSISVRGNGRVNVRIRILDDVDDTIIRREAQILQNTEGTISLAASQLRSESGNRTKPDSIVVQAFVLPRFVFQRAR